MDSSFIFVVIFLVLVFILGFLYLIFFMSFSHGFDKICSLNFHNFGPSGMSIGNIGILHKYLSSFTVHVDVMELRICLHKFLKINLVLYHFLVVSEPLVNKIFDKFNKLFVIMSWFWPNPVQSFILHLHLRGAYQNCWSPACLDFEHWPVAAHFYGRVGDARFKSISHKLRFKSRYLLTRLISSHLDHGLLSHSGRQRNHFDSWI